MGTVYFATNRRANTAGTSFGKDFNRDGISALRFGKATVKGGKVAIKTHRESIVPDKDEQMTDVTKSTFGSGTLFAELRETMSKDDCDTLVFVHGYNVSFKDAVKAADKLSKKLRAQLPDQGLNVVLFSWPSDGSMKPWIAYSNDRRDAAASGAALARALAKFRDFLIQLKPEEHCNRDTHLMAHSMGNYVLRHGLQEMLSQTGGRPGRLFNQIFLMAADEDEDAFEERHKLKLLPRLARRVNVYFNREDRAMAVSDVTKGNPDRLGDDGPRAPFQVPAKVTQIDCTPVVSGVVEHSYYLDTPEVVKDVAAVLAGEEPHEVGKREFVEDRNRFVLK